MMTFSGTTAHRFFLMRLACTFRPSPNSYYTHHQHRFDPSFRYSYIFFCLDSIHLHFLVSLLSFHPTFAVSSLSNLVTFKFYRHTFIEQMAIFLILVLHYFVHVRLLHGTGGSPRDHLLLLLVLGAQTSLHLPMGESWV
jgi:hypothetical protein